MEVNQLQYFMILAKTEHMTKAAELLNITQPTLSKSISNLEAELGVALFDRIGHQIVLNHDGRVLRRYAQQVLADLELTRQVMHDLHTGASGGIAIGSTMTFDPASPVRRYLADYFLRNPTVSQKVYTTDLDRLADKLLARRFDFIFSIRIPDTPGVVWTPLYESNLDILVPETHPLAEKSALTLDDLCGERLLCNVTVAEGLDIVQNLATLTGRDPELLYDGYDMELIASAVGHGLGVGIVSSTALEEFRAVSGLAAAEQPVRVLPLRDEKLNRMVCVGHRSDMGFPPYLRSFFDGLVRFCRG